MKENLFDMGPNFTEGWSTDNRSKNDENESPTKIIAPSKHKLHFGSEKRRGKTVTIAGEFSVEKNELRSLLKKLKKSLGRGGTIKGNNLEFQGDIKETLSKALRNLGYGLK